MRFSVAKTRNCGLQTEEARPHRVGHAEAERFFTRPRGTLEAALGSEHSLVAQSLNNLAEVYRAQGHYAEAEPLYRRSLAIVEKTLGPEHPHMAASLNNLALLYQPHPQWRSYNVEDGDNLSQSTLSTGEGMSQFDHGWWLPVSSFRVEGDSVLLSVRNAFSPRRDCSLGGKFQYEGVGAAPFWPGFLLKAQTSLTYRTLVAI